MSHENLSFSKPLDIINAFDNFFAGIFTMSDEEFSPMESNFSIHNIHFESITEQEILEAANKLKNKLTSGLDNIPSFIVKDCASVLVVPLCFLFNLAVKCETLPEAWKTSRVCPIFKNGDKTLVSYYRPISILSNFAKLLEIVLYNRIYLSVRNQLSLFQHGFLNNRSAKT